MGEVAVLSCTSWFGRVACPRGPGAYLGSLNPLAIPWQVRRCPAVGHVGALGQVPGLRGRRSPGSRWTSVPLHLGMSGFLLTEGIVVALGP